MSVPYVLLDNTLDPDGVATLFCDPVEEVVVLAPEELHSALQRLEAARAEGLYLAGYLSYEVGALLESKLTPGFRQHPTAPLLWMGLFKKPQTLSRAESDAWLAQQSREGHQLEDLGFSQSEERYLSLFNRVKDYIAAGDVYQINLTLRQKLRLAGSPASLYRDLRKKQRVRHGALLSGGDFSLLSLSPELFLQVEKAQAKARPMKGTAARGRTAEEDERQAAWLASDEKSRAENLMIVDLLRNDLGRAALIGSVNVTDLFTVEAYPTLHQMTSGITARLLPNIGLLDLLRSLFPCGSITGAPKVRAMEIIRELEPEARGPYTGSIGMIAPNGDLRFNVAIRTLYFDSSGEGELGIGSGLVHDSEGKAEYAECLLKAAFLNRPQDSFELIETLRWQGGYDLLEAHLMRLAKSAKRFHFVCDLEKVRMALDQEARGFSAPAYRVRLLLDEGGEVTVSATAIPAKSSDQPFTYAFSPNQVQSSNAFLYHKTTQRGFYDSERERLSAETGCDEVIFLNERGEVTEGSITTVFIEEGGELLTPPIESGLLPGTLRQSLFEDPTVSIRERVIRPEDLEAADAVYLGNSVRGLMPATPYDHQEKQRRLGP